MKRVVAYTTTWCGPCKMMKPILNELVNEGYVIEMIDPDENPEAAKNAGVQSVPTFLFFENENKYDEYVGYLPKQQMLKKLNG